jgi:hypothetical protein
MSYSPTSGVKQTGLVSLGKRISGDSASHAKGEIAERDGAITVRALCIRCSLATPLVPDDGHDDGHERNGHNDRWHKGGNCIAHQPSLSIPAGPITAQLRAKKPGTSRLLRLDQRKKNRLAQSTGAGQAHQ